MVVGGESKVGQLAGHALVGDQDVLRLQVPVVDSNGVAILYGIQNLEKGPLRKSVVSNVLALLRDIGEEVTFRAVLNDHIGAVRGIHDLYQGNHIGVGAGLVVELDLPLLELLLPRLQAKLVESLDGIGGVGVDVQSGVHYSIGANTENSGELQSSSQDLA